MSLLNRALRGILPRPRPSVISKSSTTTTRPISTTSPRPNSPPPNPSSTGPSYGSPQPPPQPPNLEPHWLGHPFRFAVSTLKYLALAHLFWEYGFSLSPATGPSMLPTFELLGEWLLVSKSHRLGRNISVGDLVIYNIPISEDVGVKRVLGMPGDYLLIDTPEYGSDNSTCSMIQVPQGHCWIVGDNLPASRDSRLFGPVPLALVRGKVIASMIPFSEFRWIKNPLQKVEDESLQS